jgi:hypothetical protein
MSELGHIAAPAVAAWALAAGVRAADSVVRGFTR